MYLRTFGLLALYLFGFAACDYPYDPNADDLEATGTEVLLTTGSIDFGSLALPSTPFTLEARVLWTVPAGVNTSQTFWFYGTPTNYVWIGGIQTASSTASPLYVVVNNGTALSANAAGTVVRPLRSSWIFFSVAFTSTDIKFNVIGWNPSGLSSTLSNNTFSIPFDSSAVPSSGRRHLFGDAPDSVKNQTRVLLSAASSASFPGSVDELRIFNSSRSFDDFYTSCIARLAADTPNIYALWTIEEEAGAVILTDKVASRIATVNGTVQAQSSYVMVTNLNYILNPSQSLSVPVRTFSSTTDGYTVTLTTPNTTVSVCYQKNSICYPFPVSLPTFTLTTANPIIFTPLRTSCNSTVVNTFVPIPSSQNPFTVTIKYLPYTFTVNEPSANVSSTSGSIVKLTGSFGLGYEDMSLDNVTEFVQFTGDSSGTTKSNLPVTINSTGMFITFGQGYGVGQINMTLCRQNIILPVYYPPPSISSLVAYDFTYFEIQGSNFGDKTRTWATNAVVFVTNGTEAINCIVSESTDSSIKCTLEQNKALSLGQPVNITVNIGSIPTKYFISSFDPCNGSCKNGGKCVGLNTCDCSLTYYEGNECQTELSCLPNCTSNGICARINATDPETDNYCQCEDGYEGKSCSQKISSGSTPVALIAGVTVGGGVLILGLAVVVVILLIRSKNQRRGGKNFIPLHKKDFTKIIYGEQLNQDPEKTDADLDKLEQMLIEDNLEVAVAVSNITQITEADKIAKALVVVFQNSDKVLTLLQAFIAEEVNTTESAGTLFRSNSMVSKMFKFYSRLIGLPYLYETIGPELCELIEEELGLEVDPEKMEEGTDLDEMRWMLMAQSQKILKSVLNSVERCPPQFRTLFNHIKRCVADRFPENVNTTIGGFIFLRFFCPAVSSPEAYGIVDEPPSASARRLLILITKVLQNLSNDVEFGSKEPYMTKMNDFIHSNRQKLTEFYDKLVKPANKANVTCTLPKNMRAVSLAVIANHIKDNLGKVENATVKSRLESVFKS